MVEKYRDIKNYEVQIAPFQDANSKAVFMEAVYTLGKYEIDIEEKTIYWNVKAWASVDAFEYSGKSFGIVKEYRLNDKSGLTFDAVMERFPNIKSETGTALNILMAELDADMHSKIEVIPET